MYQFQSLTFLKLNELVEPVNEHDNLANADPAVVRFDAKDIAADSLGLVITEIELMAKG